MLAPLFLLLALLAPDEELVAEFLRYYGKDKSPVQRREAVLNLAEADSLSATKALVEAFEDEEFLVRRAAVEVVAGFRTEESARWLVEGVLEDRKLSRNKELVASVAEALGGMGFDLALDPLVALMENRDLNVRLGALAGLGRLGEAGRGAVPTLVARVQTGKLDEVETVATLAALGAIGDAEGANPAVLTGLGHESKHVRLAAIAEVERLRLKDGVRPLIMMMGEDPDTRVQEDAYEVLKVLTLRSFDDSVEAWLRWWDRNETRFELPDLEKVAEAKKLLAEQGSRYSVGAKSFQDIQTKSENIVFVIDVSQSMSEPFGDPERLKASGREYSSLQRLEIVKEELINTVEALTETTNFNIVAYATDVDIWKRKAVKASVLNRSNARGWIEALKPKGGQQANFRQRMGHLDRQSDEGKTNTHLALMTAFGEDIDDRKSNAFVTKITDPVDTIFFLTDGEPTVGKTVDMSEIREEVKRVNAFRGVQLHVIYVGAFGGDDFRKLAEDNGGVFVSIGG